MIRSVRGPLPTTLLLALVGSLLLPGREAGAFTCGGGPGRPAFHALAFGLQGGGAAGAASGGRLGLELGYLTGPAGLCNSGGFPFWASAGLVADPRSGRTRIYTELGSWFFLALGAGYGVGLAGDREAAHSAHGFVGLPVPLNRLFFQDAGFGWGLYVTPYYRPTWFAGEASSWSHEVGIALKVSTHDFD